MGSTSMNLFQRVSVSGAFLVITALVAGLGFSIRDAHDAGVNDPYTYLSVHYDTVLVALILLTTRLKFLLDNHGYFADFQQDKLYARLIGFLLATVCWILYGVAATTILKPVSSLEVMALGIIVSSLWLVVHVWEVIRIRNANGKIGSLQLHKNQWPDYQFKWIIFNIIYLFIIALYTGYKVKVPDCVKESSWLLVLFLFAIFVDFIVSKTYIDVLSTKQSEDQDAK